MMNISEMITQYNVEMESLFNSNQFLIGMITTAIAGGLVYVFRKLWDFSIIQFRKHLTTTIDIDSGNDSYHKIMQYIAKKKIIQKSRYLLITNGMWGYEKPVLSLGTGIQFIRLFGKICTIYVKQEDIRDRITYKVSITYLGRSHYLANKLMSLAEYNNTNEYTEVVVAGNEQSYLQKREYIKNRFYVEAEHKLYKIVEEFINNEEDYVTKNIPYKLGILLHGIPGTGKTSVIRSLAGEFGLKICILNSFSDFDKIPNEKCIVVLDEVDMMLGDASDDDNDQTSSNSAEYMKSVNRFTLSVALKKLDGIIQKHGVIVIGTTNRPNAIDKALLRPGRLGYQIEFSNIQPKEFESAVNKYYGIPYILEGTLKHCTSAELMGAYVEGLDREEFINRFVENKGSEK